MSIFNENMTSTEARMLLFSIVEGKTDQELEKIYDEYDKVSSVIFRREMRENRGWMASY